MKKVYVILGTVLVTGISAIALNACGNAKTDLAADEQPVDLSKNSNAASAASHPDQEVAVTVAEFDKTIKEAKLTMVDFYTTWCGPCKRMAPFVRQVKAEMADVVNVMQVDAEAQAEIANRYNLEAYPTLIFFKKGQIVGTVIGGKTHDELVDLVNRLK